MPDLHFNPTDHTYHLDGNLLPSVTRILRSVVPIDYGPQTEEQREWVMQRGRAVHHACHLADAGRLRWESVDERIAGRVRAWMKFIRDAGATVQHSETPLAHPVYRFAGTLDRILDVGGVVTVADIKSQLNPQDRLQCAAYSLLASANKLATPNAAAVVALADDETYRTDWLNKPELRQAEREFLACLTVFNWKSTVPTFHLPEKKSHGESQRHQY